MTIHFPRSCLHCEKADCVTVCPTGASYKRSSDGIVLVEEDKCIGCGLCAWACPYGARELDTGTGTMKKCTLCVDRIYNDTLPEAERVPACVAACPAGARHFGDFGDPNSDISNFPPAVAAQRRWPISATNRPTAICHRGRGGAIKLPKARLRATPERRPPAAFSAGSTARSRTSWRRSMHPAPSVILFTTLSAPATACWHCSARLCRLGCCPMGSGFGWSPLGWRLA